MAWKEHLAEENMLRAGLIRIEGGNLVSLIREYCREQVEMWRKVPELARSADGRNGYSRRYMNASGRKLWQVDESEPYLGVFVDLQTGELVGRKYLGNGRFAKKELPDNALVGLAFRLELLDAQKVIGELEERVESFPEKGVEGR